MRKALIITVFPVFLYVISIAQPSEELKKPTFVLQQNTKIVSTPNRINFYVANKLKTFDLFSRLVIWRARIYGMSRQGRFIIVLAGSSEEAKVKMMDYLKKKNAIIGNLWFDSHGHYINGYSSFSLGKDEFSYKTITDTAYTKHLRALAPYCDDYTKVSIGSCYSGATFEKPSDKGKMATRMNGDSLIIGLANILPGSTVFGTESWVMTKPGIFEKNSFALAGYPMGRSYKAEIYRPIWERMGIWHSYSTNSGVYETVNTLSLTRLGTIFISPMSYLDIKQNQNKLARILKKMDRRSKRKKQHEKNTFTKA